MNPKTILNVNTSKAPDFMMLNTEKNTYEIDYSSHTVPLVGAFRTYDASGYVTDYDLFFDYAVVRESVKTDFEVFKANNWLDTVKTQMMVISFTVYNLHYDMWCMVDLLIEFPHAGGVLVPSSKITPFRPNLFETQQARLGVTFTGKLLGAHFMLKVGTAVVLVVCQGKGYIC